MEYRILGAMKKYKGIRPARFHMPGHQANRKIFSLFRDAALDITELSFSDCLEAVSYTHLTLPTMSGV